MFNDSSCVSISEESVHLDDVDDETPDKSMIDRNNSSICKKHTKTY